MTSSDRLAEVAYHGTAEGAVGQSRNCVNHRPELAAVIRRELPGLVEALERLDEMVMPEGREHAVGITCPLAPVVTVTSMVGGLRLIGPRYPDSRCRNQVFVTHRAAFVVTATPLPPIHASAPSPVAVDLATWRAAAVVRTRNGGSAVLLELGAGATSRTAKS